MKNMKKAIPILVLCLALGVWLVGCASSGKGKPETVNCDAKIHWSVTEQVQLTNFGCVLDKHGGQDSLIFTVGLMNPTEKPLRYRVNIFLEDMDKAAGHYVPRKGKNPVYRHKGTLKENLGNGHNDEPVVTCHHINS